jgi:hypothetical protein
MGDASLANDYWTIPYRCVEGVLTEATLRTIGETSPRWQVQIINHQFTVFPRGKQRVEVDVGKYYGLPPKL